jgi:hypothetical protein
MVPGNSSPDDVISGGCMSWANAVAGPLVGCACLWQDLDRLRMKPAPVGAPPTSILWGRRADSLLVRVRLDSDAAYVAVHDAAASRLTGLVPWSSSDGQGLGPELGGVGARYKQVIVGGGGGSITFVRPARAVGDG